MADIILEEKHLLECVRDLLSQYSESSLEISNAKYHHNSSYKNAPSIIEKGILSIKALNNLKVRTYSEEFLKLMSNTDSHINGCDGISLSVVGLDDIYPGEEEYSPLFGHQVDFLIDSGISAYRSTTFYGNEYIANYAISNDKIRSIDVRIFDDLDSRVNGLRDISNSEVLLIKYNSLREIASSLRKTGISIPIRENSDNNNRELNILKLVNSPRLILK